MSQGLFGCCLYTWAYVANSGVRGPKDALVEPEATISLARLVLFHFQVGGIFLKWFPVVDQR